MAGTTTLRIITTLPLRSAPPTRPLPPIPTRIKPFPSPTPSSSSPPSSSPPTPEQARVLVGPEKTEFAVDRALLAAVAPVFRDGLDSSARGNKHHHPPCIWLANEAPVMFELFVLWLHQRPRFRRLLDRILGEHRMSTATITRTTATTTTSTVADSPDTDSLRAQKMHWGLVRLHLFAARLGLAQLQDAAMDALQDLYLRRNWDVTPRLVRFLYASHVAGSDDGVRIRRWAVAMVAWQLAGLTDHDLACNSPLSVASTSSATTTTSPDKASSSPPPPPPPPQHSLPLSPRVSALFSRYPGFAADYAAHVHKMRASGFEMRIKNPQLRMPANKLRSEERSFAFRQCSFHSHRAAIGERQCPHVVGIRGRSSKDDEGDKASAAPSESKRPRPAGDRGDKQELTRTSLVDQSVLASYMQHTAIVGNGN